MKIKWIALSFLGALPFEVFGGSEETRDEVSIETEKEDLKEAGGEASNGALKAPPEKIIWSSLSKIPSFSSTNVARAIRETRLALRDAARRAELEEGVARAKDLIAMSEEDSAKKILSAFRVIQDQKNNLNERCLNAPYNIVRDDDASKVIAQAAKTLTDLEARELLKFASKGAVVAPLSSEYASENVGNMGRELEGAWLTLQNRVPEALMGIARTLSGGFLG